MARRRSRFRRTVEHARRYRHIMAVLMRYGFEDVTGSIGRRLSGEVGRRAVPGRVRRAAEGRTRAARLRLALQDLGPTFIKLGQLLSTRPDLLPAEYIEELERLQDQVAPEKFPRVRKEIETQLGGPLEKVFARFDPKPLAAGSIAQVYRATTHAGEAVVVKVRRPGIVQTLATECEILEGLAGWLKSALFADDTIDPHRMVTEFTSAVMKEVDLARERRNQVRFARAFAADPHVHIPAVYEPYCADGVLTMEYIDGIKPNDGAAIDAAGLDRSLLARRGADFGMRQIFEQGFFHTDPHPGNFFFLPGNRLALIDFGQVGHLTRQDRRLLREIVLSVVDGDMHRALRSLERRNLLSEQTDTAQLVRDAEEMIDAYLALPLKDIPFRQAMTEGFDLVRRHRIHPPAEFTLMFKSMMTIEAFALGLDPGFEILDHLRPQARRFRLRLFDPRTLLRETRRAGRDLAELAAGLPDDLNLLMSRLRRGQIQLRIHHEHLENLANTLDKSSNRISFALIIAALLVGSSMLVSEPGHVFGFIRLQMMGILGYTAAAVMGIWLLVSILRSRHF